MRCKVEEYVGDLHSKVDRILCLLSPSEQELISQANTLEKTLNLGIDTDPKYLIELEKEYPMFNFHKGISRYIVTIKGGYVN